MEHRDRLARFGVEYIEASMQCAGKSLVVVNETEKADDLVQDFIDVVIHVRAHLWEALCEESCRAGDKGGQ